MSDIVFYSTGCPKCKVLKKKLDDKGIKYTENHSIDDMLALGIREAPTLSVNGNIMNFQNSIKWLNGEND